MQGRKWTVAGIAAENEASGGYYFAPGTLRFFGQSRGEFRVYQGGGRVFVFAEAHRGWDMPGLSSCGEFNPETGSIDSLDHPDGIGEQWTREELKTYVAKLRKAA